MTQVNSQVGMYREIRCSKTVSHALGRYQDSQHALGPQVHGVRNDGKAHRAEAGNGAAYGWQTLPATSFRLLAAWPGQGFFGVFACIAREFLHLDAIFINADINQKTLGYRSVGPGLCC